MMAERNDNQDISDPLSSESRYPNNLWNKTVVANGTPVGRVVRETRDTIVIFGDSDSRFDVPKAKIEELGGSIVIKEALDQYSIDRNAPMPNDVSLGPPPEEIIQKAGQIPGDATVPVQQDAPSVLEEKVNDVANELKGVGTEIEGAAKAAKVKVEEIGVAALHDAQEAAKIASREITDLAKSSTSIMEEKLEESQANREASLSADSALEIERESKLPTTDLDMASYEGKYPKDLFNKTVAVDNRPIGRVVKETDKVIVVFSDDDNSTRFDIPKAEIELAGGSVIVSEDLLLRYRVGRDDPMPADMPLRPSADEIRSAAAEQLRVESENRVSTPDTIMEEGRELAVAPRSETTTVSMPEDYIDTESELSKKIKRALAELKELVIAGTKVAKKKAREAQQQAVEKQAELDAQAISQMGDLSVRFADSFEEILSEIRTQAYADQEVIYTGFLKLMDTQRDLVVARRDLARRLRDSVTVPVAKDEQPEVVDVQPALLEYISERGTPDEGATEPKRTRKVSRTKRKGKSPRRSR